MSKTKSNISVFLITGPGHHAKLLIDALSGLLQRDFTYTTYWPEFATYSRKADGTSVLLHKSWIYSLLNTLVWALAARVKCLKKANRHLELSYHLFDRYTKSRYKGASVLWAWAQVSAGTMAKAKAKGAKVILEYPMIHCDEWQTILKSAMGDTAYSESHSNFSSSMVKRMHAEYELADQINLLSTYAKDTFMKHGVMSSKLHLSWLYNQAWQPVTGRQVKDEALLKIVFVGRIELLKGMKNLTAALQRVSFPFHLYLVGTVYEESKPYLEPLEGRYTLMGYLSGPTLAQMYESCHVLVLPSLQESFGMVLLESLACGTPVLASKHTGAPDIIAQEKEGFLFDPMSVEELISGFEYFYKQIIVQHVDFFDVCRIASLKFNSARYSDSVKNLLDTVS